MSKGKSLAVTVSTGDNNEAVTLNCAVINTKREVLVEPFRLLVLRTGPCSLIIAYSKMAIPSLRPIDFDKFSLHAPSDDLPATAPLDLKISGSGSGRRRTFNARHRMDTTKTIKESFLKPKDSYIDVIICVAATSPGMYSSLTHWLSMLNAFITFPQTQSQFTWTPYEQ
jgi:hypothetical protein